MPNVSRANEFTRRHIRANAGNQNYRYISANLHCQHKVMVHGFKSMFTVWYEIDHLGQRRLIATERFDKWLRPTGEATEAQKVALERKLKFL